MPKTNPLAALTALLHPRLHVITHRGRPYARYLDFCAPLLVALRASPARSLDVFASTWATSSPATKEGIARRALTPRFLASDVAKRACALSPRRVTQIVDENFEALRGLIFADNFIGPETGEVRQALTLHGAEGVNRFLVLVSKAQPVRGLYRGCQFIARIADTIRNGQDAGVVSALVAAIDALCQQRLDVLAEARRVVATARADAMAASA